MSSDYKEKLEQVKEERDKYRQVITDLREKNTDEIDKIELAKKYNIPTYVIENIISALGYFNAKLKKEGIHFREKTLEDFVSKTGITNKILLSAIADETFGTAKHSRVKII